MAAVREAVDRVQEVLNECTKRRGPEIEDFAVVRFILVGN